MREMTLAANAKVNLALDILAKRPDGYHDLRMVMQSVSLCDQVTVRETEAAFSVVVDGFALPEGKLTMEQRAAEAFFRELDRPVPGLAIRVEKHIPAYAGMGGGSADVAAVLRVLRLWYAPDMPEETLERIGLQVGSDVPFCLRGGTALAEGRGEQLTTLPPLPACQILICKPDFDLPTPALFGRVRVETLRDRPDCDALALALREKDLTAAARQMKNVFEQVLLPKETEEISFIKEVMLHCGAINAAMTGSGPTVFGLFDDGQAAARGADLLKQRYRQVFLASPV